MKQSRLIVLLLVLVMALAITAVVAFAQGAPAPQIPGFGPGMMGGGMMGRGQMGSGMMGQGGRMGPGMMNGMSGMMGSFNTRFARPGDIAELYMPGADGPLHRA